MSDCDMFTNYLGVLGGEVLAVCILQFIDKNEKLSET